jgi:hypothetical protein
VGAREFADGLQRRDIDAKPIDASGIGSDPDLDRPVGFPVVCHEVR